MVAAIKTTPPAESDLKNAVIGWLRGWEVVFAVDMVPFGDDAAPLRSTPWPPAMACERRIVLL
jgi:hypothetical protein